MASRFWNRQLECYFEQDSKRPLLAEAWRWSLIMAFITSGLEWLHGVDRPFSWFITQLVTYLVCYAAVIWLFRLWLRRKFNP